MILPMQIDIQTTVPPALTPTILERIEAVEDLFPGWCAKLVVTYSINNEDVMTCDVQYEYRTMVLHIHPLFFEDEDWEHSLTHEIGHALLKPIIQFGDKLIEHFVNDEGMSKFLLDQYSYLEEQIVEDMALFAKALREKN